MSTYTFPDLSKHQIIFNGRRYKAFLISINQPFQDYEDDADFVVWDGLYDAAVSYGVISTKGMYSGFLAFSHVEIEIDSAFDIRTFVKNSSKEQQKFFRDSGV
jgi:hypothetical protein